MPSEAFNLLMNVLATSVEYVSMTILSASLDAKDWVTLSGNITKT